ncbi:hypothetical protein E3V33_06505 [Candidatus Marinimicrobia bacterium MT.SAG.4]|nr:hypothetical protein E3V33_06505 [Candidatus Marinimicrobia bacterium MT.SAG.4]
MPDIELAGSFIIGGMLLLSILSLNADIMQTATINNLDTNAQQNVTNIVSILEYDFRKMGYLVPSGIDAITDMTDSTINFLADVDNDGSVDSVSFYLGPTSEPSETENPNDRYLYRRVNGTAYDVALGIRDWSLTYYDISGNITVTPANVRSIRIAFWVQTIIAFDLRYGEARWEGRFTPKNL